MRNPWLDIPLEDYEAHMSLPYVGQARLLADILGNVLDRYRPTSVALVGCAGGNGLKEVAARPIDRAVGVDINASYIDQARSRWATELPMLSLFVGDIQTDDFAFEPVDLVFAGLLLEYVEVPKTLERIRSMLHPNGTLVTVIQLPNASATQVTPSLFFSLRILEESMRLVSSDEVRTSAMKSGFREIDEQTVKAVSAKEFSVQAFRLISQI